MWSAALDNSGVLLSYYVISLSSPISIILISTLKHPHLYPKLQEEDDFFGISPGPLIKAKLRGQQANKANKANKANNEWSSNSSSSLRESSSSVNMLDLFSSTDISPLFSYSASNANTSSSGNGNNSGASASNDRQNKGIGIGIDAADSRGSVGTGNVMARMSQQGQSRPSLSLIRSSLTVRVLLVNISHVTYVWIMFRV